MPVLSYIHQLFNVDQCQAYIHTLRWGSRRYRRKMYGKRSFGPPTPAPHRSWLIIPGLTSVVLQRRPASAVLRCVRSLTAGQWPTY